MSFVLSNGIYIIPRFAYMVPLYLLIASFPDIIWMPNITWILEYLKIISVILISFSLIYRSLKNEELQNES